MYEVIKEKARDAMLKLVEAEREGEQVGHLGGALGGGLGVGGAAS